MLDGQRTSGDELGKVLLKTSPGFLGSALEDIQPASDRHAPSWIDPSGPWEQVKARAIIARVRGRPDGLFEGHGAPQRAPQEKAPAR